MRKISPGRRAAPWRSLLNGGRFCWYWAMQDNGYWNYGVCTADQRPTAGYAVLAREEFPDLTGGIDRLIIASRFTDDGVGVAYSYPSWVADGAALGRTAKVIVENLGLQHRLVNLADVEVAGVPADLKLLVIQQAGCMSAGQAEALRRYVRGGGVLLCVGRCGWRDLHGAPHAAGSVIDPLTGVNTRAAEPLNRRMSATGKGGPLMVFVESKVVKAGDCIVLASVNLDGAALPVFTRRNLGKGSVYWLNSNLKDHRKVASGGVAGERTIATGGPEAVRQSHFKAFTAVVDAAGVRPRCRLYVGDVPLLGTETWYYRSPSGRTTFVARYVGRTLDAPVTVRFDRPAHVYGMRAGKYFGRTNKITDTFPPGRVKLYALCDYRVTGLKATASPSPCRAGQTVTVACRVLTSGPAADLHAVRLEAAGPAGKPCPEWKTVLTGEGGRLSTHLPTALDQPAGEYRLTLTDTISGAKANATFRVAERRQP
jgi:hypothetical protein